MVSGLFSAKTVVHLSTARATSSFEHAVAVCIETPALNTSTMALIPRRVCIISLHLFGDITNISSLHFFRPAVPRNTMRADVACRAVPATTLPPHAEQRDELARACSLDHLVGALLEMYRFVEAKRHQLVGLGAEHGARVLEPWATFCLVRDDNCNPHRDAA
jgi:hypothetical protein